MVNVLMDYPDLVQNQYSYVLFFPPKTKPEKPLFLLPCDLEKNVKNYIFLNLFSKNEFQGKKCSNKVFCAAKDNGNIYNFS